VVEKKENISIGIDGEEEWFIRRMIRRHFGKVAAGSILLPLKAGMTNDSFLFTVHGEKYIFRYNGYGTERLIDRENEKRVYDLIRFLGITEHVVALSVKPGYKISRYYEKLPKPTLLATEEFVDGSIYFRDPTKDGQEQE